MGYCERILANTSQKASDPGEVIRYPIAVKIGVDGKALIVTEVMTPKVEPPP